MIIARVSSHRQADTVKSGRGVGGGFQAKIAPETFRIRHRGTVPTCPSPQSCSMDGNGAKIRGMDGPEGCPSLKTCTSTGIRLVTPLLARNNCGVYYPSHLLQLPLCLHNCHRECCLEVVEVHPVTSIAKELEPALSPQAADLVRNKLISNIGDSYPNLYTHRLSAA